MDTSLTAIKHGDRFITTHHGITKIVEVASIRERKQRIVLREIGRQDSFTLSLPVFSKTYQPYTA